MSARFSDRTVQAAARWYARLHAFDCTPGEREEFERWRSEDPSHAAAYTAALGIASLVRRKASTNARLRAMTEQALAAGTGPVRAARLRRRFGVVAALAASVIVAVGVANLWRTAPGSSEPATVAHVATDDSIRSIVLEDGTTMHVDVSSDLEVHFAPRRREVFLRQGRAVFDVAQDTERPFSVVTGGGRVTAVGTRFQVSQTATGIVVTLAEGIVTVADEPGGTQRSERLVPGDELSILPKERVWVKRTVDPQAATSWSVGRLVFRRTRLADALQEINRYAATKVRLADPTLVDLPVSGTFIAGDSEAAVAAFAAVLPLTLATDGGELLLFRRPSEQR
jgi:transmembrane sensor